MKATRNWLKKYIDRDFSIEEIKDGLTKAGIEVESVDDLSISFSGVVVGKVVERIDHPQADRLSLCQVDVGEESLLQIICGAPNCREGMKTPVAKVGAILPGGLKIAKAKLKGIESQGMLCAAQELGMDAALISESDREGIWTLPESWPVGMDLLEAIGFDDITFELGITPNRADCFGMLNVARELAMMHREKVNVPCVRQDESDEDIHSWIDVEIEDEALCHRYIARVVQNVRMGPSPLWMQKLLRASGIRPINNIVDVTNFVMLETGQPLHAFDYDKLEGKKIIVRKARAKEKMITLDAVERVLDDDMIIIADAKKPVAIAGVMGGANTEVDIQTTNVLFESAHFDYAHIRNASRRLGLRSEASGRFERGVAPEISMYAIQRAVDLVVGMEAGEPVPGVADKYPVKQEKHVIELYPDRVNKTLGTDISPTEMLSYFVRLGFGVKTEEGSNHAVVDVPYYRMDITSHVDLIEEVARIYGLENIPTTLPVTATNTKRQKAAITLGERVKDKLSALGLMEVITYAFIHPDEYRKLSIPQKKNESLALLNPLSEAQSVMRTTLLPGLLNVAKNNLRKNQKNLAIYELGKVFFPMGKDILPREERHLACLMTGEKQKNWYGFSNQIDFYVLKGIVEALFMSFHMENIQFVPEKNSPVYHPGRCARILMEDRWIGTMGEVHPLVGENYGLTQRVYLLEMQLDGIEDIVQHVMQYKELPKYPSVSRDIAFTISEDITDASIMKTIEEASSDKLVDYRLFDVYNGEQIEDGYKSLAYTLTYQDKERTLTDDEVTKIHQTIQNNLEEHLGAKLRK